ncbi:MAG: RNA-binding transcriptional accessory protein [Oligoflexales bacterium]|nr:RNA-binding transcriptional accessory protein [Oligoflexales bacterium]
MQTKEISVSLRPLSAIDICRNIAQELKLKETQVHNVVTLLFNEDCTIPFVARYRKELTGSLDEVVLRDIRDKYQYRHELEEQKGKYWKVIIDRSAQDLELQKRLPELSQKFVNCESKQVLEDLYLPFKPKRRTRAQAAKEKGLGEFAELILSKCADKTATLEDLWKELQSSSAQAELLSKSTFEEAKNGASDILAELWSEDAELRALIRSLSFASGILVAEKAEVTIKAASPKTSSSKAAGAKATAGLATPQLNEGASKAGKRGANHYENYYNYREPIGQALAHRIMAVRRGETEGELKLSVLVDNEKINQEFLSWVQKQYRPNSLFSSFFAEVCLDAYKRLLAPAIETEIRLDLRRRGEAEAIQVFSKNLKNLLMLPPLPDSVVLGVDPGIRTGSKLAAVSSTGKLLGFATIYPSFKSADNRAQTQAKGQDIEASQKLLELVRKNNVQYIAIGNGTGSKEIDTFIRTVLEAAGIKDIKRAVVNESGASVYSTDDIAREEFPDLDPTIRSAVSIARRLQDPLAELVKIDPRSIGVGQYQHDVNVNHLSQSLKEVVESCVNNVGVNINTASFKLLSYVSGIGASLAKNIVKQREAKGAFKSRQQLLEIAGFGPKAFEQAAGFLRVAGAEHPLDNSSVHPERYLLVENIIKDLNKKVEEVLAKSEYVNTIAWEKYISDSVGMPTLMDIKNELLKPGRDPREDGARLFYSDDVNEMSDLKPGMKLKGTVTNVTNFGAFVDIGVHQDGLVHISELTDKFIKDPAEVVGVGDVLDVTVLDVDLQKKRISLSCKAQRVQQQQSSTSPQAKTNHNHGGNSSNKHNNLNTPLQNSNRGEQERYSSAHKAQHTAQQKSVQKPVPSYSMEDLMAKFGKAPR